MRISQEYSSTPRRPPVLAMLSVCHGDVSSNVGQLVTLVIWPPRGSGLARRRDRIGWLAWWWRPCIPAMHSRWTPRPSWRITPAGKPREAVLLVSLTVGLTGVHLHCARRGLDKKYCLNHCARTCCSLRNVTRCRFTNWRIRCERGGRNVHFLSINWLAFAGHVVLFWLNSTCFEVGLIRTVIDNVTGSQRAA